MAMHTFSFPTLIHFGPGVRRQIGSFLKEKGIKRPLIVTDRGVAEQPFLKEIALDLTANGLSLQIFSGVFGNPVKSQVTHGVSAFFDHKADGIVGIGGGAALDVTKAIALMSTHPGDLLDYEDGKLGALPISAKIPYWVGVPTTAGTGSEVGRAAVISDDTTHAKKIVFSPHLLAKAVFADPELTVSLPAKITAATGMDALTHCVESYLAKDYHPICDGIALEGLALAANNLARCVSHPEDLDARGAMMMSSMMGAIAFQKGLGLTHSCAHALSTVADLHHGLANGIMIPYALKFNVETVRDRFQTMAIRIGLKDPGPQEFITWLTQLKKAIGIPGKLSEAGVKKEHLPRLAELAFADSCHQNNPVPCTQKDFTQIYSEAF